MYIEKLNLKNFRNYAEQDVTLNPHINIFYGDKEKRKTNILEAVFLGGFGKSFRTSKEKEKHTAETQPQVSTKVLELIEWEASWKKTGRLIQESFSFGLMLFCIGLCLTLAYLFYVFLR